MELIVHYPQNPEKQKELCDRVAKFHADYVSWYIRKLSCSSEQKCSLIDAIVETIFEGRNK